MGSTLPTASDSAVKLVNGAQACNVYWQIGSSATLGTRTAFKGNILALTSITMNTGATLEGRALARNGAVTLDTNTVNRARCATAGTPPGGGGTPGGGTPGTGPTPTNANGAAVFTTVPRSVAKTVTRFGTRRSVTGRFEAFVTGVFIRRVVFTLDGRTIGSRKGRPPFRALVRAGPGTHTLRARVLFKDGTPAANLRLRFRVRRPATAQPRFTG